MGNYKEMSLKQAMKENDIDIQMANDREKFFYVPANRVTQIIIEQWCKQNGIETSNATRIVRDGKTGEKSFLCYDVSFEKKSIMTAPTLSPWGHIENAYTLCDGAYEVITASHGGIMIVDSMKDKYLAKYAQDLAFKWGKYLCYEEDCQAAVPYRELLDRKLIKCAPEFCGTPEAFEKHIDKSIHRWNPEYENIRANMMAYGKYVFKPGDICEYKDAPNGDVCAIVEIVSIADFRRGVVDILIRDVVRDNKLKLLEVIKECNECVLADMKDLRPCPTIPKKNDPAHKDSDEIAELLEYLKGKRREDTANMTLTEFVEKLLEQSYEDGRMAEEAYTCTEVCPHCENEITLFWTPESDGYKAYCPICGKRLMLCDACQHDGGENHICNYCAATDSCKHNPPRKKVNKK